MRLHKICSIVLAACAAALIAEVSTAQGLVVEDDGAVTITQDGTLAQVLFLKRPTGSATEIVLETNSNDWIVRAHGSGGKFRLDETNTAGIAFDLKPAGELELGGGLNAAGNSTINGNLTVTGTFSNPSSRTLKTDVEAIDSREMLRRVVALPIYSWRYKSDTSGPEQIGPMAEEFRDAIGVGDGYYLAGGTTAGVSLAAIRGLNEVVEHNGKELAQLRAHNEELVARLTALEARLAP